MGANNPMAVENFSDKMEFQGRGAAHIHGVAWCNLAKVSEMLHMDINNLNSDDELDSEDASENDFDDEDDFNKKCDLEKAFDKLRMDGKLRK